MFRNYTHDEAELLGTALAQFIIDKNKKNEIPDVQEIIQYMVKKFGVPENFTKHVLTQVFGAHGVVYYE